MWWKFVIGHFITPTHKLSDVQTAEIISSTLLPSSDCTVSSYTWDVQPLLYVLMHTKRMKTTLLSFKSCAVFMQLRFYHYCQDNSTSARLNVLLRTLRNGDDDNILWENAVTQSIRWHRVEVKFSSNVKSKVRLTRVIFYTYTVNLLS